MDKKMSDIKKKKKIQIKKDPKLFEYDKGNGIVDIHIRKDPLCPYPFHKEDWYHQGFYPSNFILFLNDFFERNKLPYEVIGK